MALAIVMTFFALCGTTIAAIMFYNAAKYCFYKTTWWKFIAIMLLLLTVLSGYMAIFMASMLWEGLHFRF